MSSEVLEAAERVAAAVKAGTGECSVFGCKNPIAGQSTAPYCPRHQHIPWSGEPMSGWPEPETGNIWRHAANLSEGEGADES